MITIAIVALSVALMLVRPREWPEAIWVCSGALLLVALRLVSLHDAAHAVGQGGDVYAFLVGMMVLSELAREEGVFDWLAASAIRRARGSGTRLFSLLYGAGTLVTIFLSNDATAVVLTPAVLAASRRANAKPLPHLFACALIANAASFVLPISNPANLVVYGAHMPTIGAWLASFALPSLLSVGATFLVLRLWFKKTLMEPIADDCPAVPLARGGKIVLGGLGLVIAALAIASWRGWELGVPTLVASTIVTLVVCVIQRRSPIPLVRHVSWTTLLLVAGLFVLVAGVRTVGVVELLQHGLARVEAMPRAEGIYLLGGAIALANNVFNNLPTGLLVGATMQHSPLTHAALIGVDLGPNLAVTGSLATILWLLALRREGQRVGFFDFLKVGAVAMPTALVAALAGLLVR